MTDLRLVHVSTDYVFGGNEAPYAPNSTPCPVNVYGASKAEGDVHVLRCGGVVARVSFLPDPPGYSWVVSSALTSKEWIDETAVRLRRFLGWISGCWLAGSGRWDVGVPYHVTTTRSVALSTLVHERYPAVPCVGSAEAMERLSYPFPFDVRLSGAWEEL